MIDKNGYAPSILQADTTRCYLCGRTDEKLDRHEVFGGPYRSKSKYDGLWVTLCHNRCHRYGVHKYKPISDGYKATAQKIAMEHYGWTTKEFIERYGKNRI